MPKSSRGGKAGTYTYMPQPKTQQSQPPQAQPQAQPTPQPGLTQPGIALDSFRNLTPDEQADIIEQMIQTPVPVFLSTSSLQRLTYGLKLNDKPAVVDDDVLDSMKGTELFRTVNQTSDSLNRMKYNADEIANQILRGSVTRMSDTGGSAYGRGLYFANSYIESTYYGNVTGNSARTAIVRAKLNANANTISSSVARSRADAEIRSGSKLGVALSKADSQSRGSIYALAKGYDVMTDSSSGYYVVLNRGALTMSKEVKPTGTKWK